MNIYWDIVNDVFVKGLSSSQRVNSLDLVLRDQVAVTLYTVEPSSVSGVYYQVVDPAAGFAPVFGAKLASDLAGGHLIYQTIWTKTATGTYTGTINLNTAELIAALGTLAQLDIVGEFVLVDSGGNNTDSSQLAITVAADVTRGGEPAPADVYVWPTSCVREELIAGQKVLILINSEGVEYARFNPPGA